MCIHPFSGVVFFSEVLLVFILRDRERSGERRGDREDRRRGDRRRRRRREADLPADLGEAKNWTNHQKKGLYIYYYIYIIKYIYTLL